MISNSQAASTNSSLEGLYSYFEQTSYFTTYSWMCGQDVYANIEGSAGVYACNTVYLDNLAANNASGWTPGGYNALLRDSFPHQGVCIGEEPTSFRYGRSPVATVICGDQGNSTIEYCLSETVPERCQINAVPLYLAIVVV